MLEEEGDKDTAFNQQQTGYSIQWPTVSSSPVCPNYQIVWSCEVSQAHLLTLSLLLPCLPKPALAGARSETLMNVITTKSITLIILTLPQWLSDQEKQLHQEGLKKTSSEYPMSRWLGHSLARWKDRNTSLFMESLSWVRWKSATKKVLEHFFLTTALFEVQI